MDLDHKVSVIGAGSWGTAVANLFADQESEVVIWGRDAKVVESIEKKNTNDKYLPGIILNPNLHASTDLEAVISRASVIICAIPVQQIRGVFGKYAGHLKGKTVINTCKGLEMGSHLRVSEVFRALQKDLTYGILSGPTFAHEVVKRLPAAITFACENRDVAEAIQKRLSGSYFRVYTSNDVAGVEFAGALKNVIAIATGLVNGLKLGYNAQAAIINRGIAEIIRMAKTSGKVQPMTFLGLAGMGDLILTCTGPLSRNRAVGVKLGEGMALNQIVKELGGVAEGVYTAKAAFELAAQKKIEMPITEQVYRILYEGRTPLQALHDLMSRDPKEEWDIT